MASRTLLRCVSLRNSISCSNSGIKLAMSIPRCRSAHSLSKLSPALTTNSSIISSSSITAVVSSLDPRWRHLPTQNITLKSDITGRVTSLDPRWRHLPTRHITRKGDFEWRRVSWSEINDEEFRPAVFDDAAFDGVADQTLEYLSEYLDEVIDLFPNIVKNDNFDVILSQGVLTVKCGKHGTFVVNKQGPNKQIWLSSPFSGPKRYDWDEEESQWSYRGQTLTSLLTEDFGKIFGETVNFYHLNVKIKAFAHENFGGSEPLGDHREH